MSETIPAATSIEGFSGEQIRPGDPAYDEARIVWNGLYDKHPALIARCASTADVVAAVNHARQAGLNPAVRAGGHSAAGHSTCEGGLVIDLTQMKGIQVDPATRTCRAQPGLTWGEFDAATQAHGLAVTGGRFSTTGIAGLTLGSGSGWLERKCGLTGDNLISAEVVTADGRVVRASAGENPELFFGLRGGSGNFGVVTEFELRLHELGPMVYGGLMACLPDRAEAILAYCREYAPSAPDDLGLGIAFVSAPPLPAVPEEMHFKPIVGVIVCWTGEREEGERVLEPLREVAQPVMDMVDTIPYVALQGMLDEGAPYGVRAYMKAEMLPEMNNEAMATLIEYGSRRPGPMVQLLLQPLGGAVARVGEDETALGRRDAPWCFHAISMWMAPDQEADDAHVSWTRGLVDDMKPHTMSGAYLNFTSDDDDERVRATYGPEKYARLVALKDAYDPHNMFRLNSNIPPSA